MRDDGNSSRPVTTENRLVDVTGSALQVGHISGDMVIHQEPVDRCGTGGIPHEVPGAPHCFVGRDEEIRELSRIAAGGGLEPPHIVVVSGMPGIGKSALVRRWAHTFRGRFPGGEIYVDFSALRGHVGADVSEAVAACLRSLGVSEESIPLSLADRVRSFRSRVRRATLIVLDDVMEPAEVLPFVPNVPGSMVVATSVRRLGELQLDGATLLVLQPLDSQGGRELLVARCGQDRVDAEAAAAAELVRLCDGLPVALQVVAARLAVRPHLTLRTVVDELTDEPRRLDALAIQGESKLSVLLASAYRALPADAARIYRRIGLAPCSDFTLDSVAVVSGVKAARAEGHLDVLLSANLLLEVVPGRYTFHELVRLHARKCAFQDDVEHQRTEAEKQLFQYYLIRAAFADRAVMGPRLRFTDHDVLLAGGADPFVGPRRATQALDWLELERVNLLGLLRLADERRWDQEAWELAETLSALYFNRRHVADWLEASGIGIAAARRAEHGAVEARLRLLVSRLYMDLGETDRAGEEVERARFLAEQCHLPVLEASAWEFYGRYLDQTNRPVEALEAYRESIRLNQVAGEDRGVALATYFLGCALDSIDGADSLSELGEARIQLERIGDRRMAARATASVGKALARRGRFDEAEAALQVAASDLRALKASHYQAQVLEALAGVKLEQGHRPAALKLLREVLDIYTASGSMRAGVVQKTIEEARHD